MLNKIITQAKMGETVYISDVSKTFAGLEPDKRLTVHMKLDLLDDGKSRHFTLYLPAINLIDPDALNFLRSYVHAEIYNILSSLGGRSMTLYHATDNELLLKITEDLNDVFGTGLPTSERQGYGRAINVIDRMLRTLAPDAGPFIFKTLPLSEMTETADAVNNTPSNIDTFIQATQQMKEKTIIGIDVGGTDIKMVAVKNGVIEAYKEYDWFPAKFTTSSQLVDPIVMLVKLLRAKLSLDKCKDCDDCTRKCDSSLMMQQRMDEALDREASDAFILDTITRTNGFLDHQQIDLHGIGLCFPDVVVMDKVVGGEVYKTRGIRNNPAIDYEEDFAQLTNLNDALQTCLVSDGVVAICNDGPMASYTAAVELAAAGNTDEVKNGVFAHTLGTELGTGWVKGDGSIPDIPLEVYNYIIDLGSFPETEFHVDDLRSINNFNTGLSGTLQKYCSQSGVFRLAMKYFPGERPDLYQELFDLGYAQEVTVDGEKHIIVPTEPVDMRKAFLEHMMALPERENDDVNARIWREIGEYLAVTWIETEKILKPETQSRYLFGRLVKRERCFELMQEGARNIVPDLQLEVANAEMANTPLMKALEGDPHYTVAQFAQAVGAVYYANK